MKIEIGGKEEVLKVRLREMRKLDEKYGEELAKTMDMSGANLGFGVLYAIQLLSMGNPVSVPEILKEILPYGYTLEEVDSFVEEYVENNSIDKLTEELIELLGKSPLISKRLRKGIENMKKEAEKAYQDAE